MCMSYRTVYRYLVTTYRVVHDTDVVQIPSILVHEVIDFDFRTSDGEVHHVPGTQGRFVARELSMLQQWILDTPQRGSSSSRRALTFNVYHMSTVASSLFHQVFRRTAVCIWYSCVMDLFVPSNTETSCPRAFPHTLTPSQDATQRSEGSPPGTNPLPRPASSAESRGMHAQQQRELQSHQPARVQQLGTSGPPRPGSSSPPQQMRVSSDEAFGVGEAFGGNGGVGASVEEEEQPSRQTLQLQPQHSSPSPVEFFRAGAGGVDAQQRVQVCNVCKEVRPLDSYELPCVHVQQPRNVGIGPRIELSFPRMRFERASRLTHLTRPDVLGTRTGSVSSSCTTYQVQTSSPTTQFAEGHGSSLFLLSSHHVQGLPREPTLLLHC